MADAKPRVVVTRPRDLAGGLCDLLRDAGAEAVALPVIRIVPLTPPSVPQHADFLLFVSRNAVRLGVPHLKRLLVTARVGAVGSGTAAALAAAGVHDTLTPPPGTAAGGAGLLCNAGLAREAVNGRRVLIVRGEGGNDELADGLRQRDAEVVCCEVYRRAVGDRGHVELAALRGGLREPVFVVTSSEGVRNLFDIAGPDLADWLRGLRFVAISPRVADALRGQGLRAEPLLSAAADDGSLAQAALRAAAS